MSRKYLSSWLVFGEVLLILATSSTHSRDAFAQDSQTYLSTCETSVQMASTTDAFELASSSMTTNFASLPDAPVPQGQQGQLLLKSGAQNWSVETIPADGSASISGVVQDISEASVVGAPVVLTNEDGSRRRTVTSGASGEFTFSNLPAGSYFVLIAVNGLRPFRSAEIVVAAQQAYQMPKILLAIASTTTEVMVRPTEEMAAEQIRAEEKQRIFGVFPNFYVSYVHDAAPLTARQKFSLSTHDTLDWTSFAGISMIAGIEQANKTYAGYGQGAAGYGKRWAAQFGDGRSSDYLSHFVFASLFHQDPRYFYQGTGTNRSRLYHALSSAFVARSDSGRTMPNYSYLLGAMCSGALSNAYYPHADRGANLVFTNAAIGIAGRAGASVVQEFLGKRMTKSASANGQP
jgi:hypothetical protein